MNSSADNKQTQRRRPYAALSGLLALGCISFALAPLSSQGQDPERTPTDTPAADASAAPDAQVLDPLDAPTAQRTSPPKPLEDYEASEQISEDLSVSFPVDI